MAKHRIWPGRKATGVGRIEGGFVPYGKVRISQIPATKAYQVSIALLQLVFGGILPVTSSRNDRSLKDLPEGLEVLFLKVYRFCIRAPWRHEISLSTLAAIDDLQAFSNFPLCAHVRSLLREYILPSSSWSVASSYRLLLHVQGLFWYQHWASLATRRSLLYWVIRALTTYNAFTVIGDQLGK